MAKSERIYAFQIIRHAELQKAAESTTRAERLAHLHSAGAWQRRASRLEAGAC